MHTSQICLTSSIGNWDFGHMWRVYCILDCAILIRLVS